MPIFEYECAGCGRRFELLQTHRDEVASCPHCGTSRVRRRLSSFSVGRSNPDRPAGCGRDDCGCRANPD